jgi:hypothetical protein
MVSGDPYVSCEVQTSSTYKKQSYRRNPHYLENPITSVKVVNLMHLSRSVPQKHFYFCLWHSLMLEAE